jgi:hypothetical protein
MQTLLAKHLPLGIQGRWLDDAQLWDLLLYASLHQTIIESACTELAQAPSGNTVRPEYGRPSSVARRPADAVESEHSILDYEI